MIKKDAERIYGPVWDAMESLGESASRLDGLSHDNFYMSFPEIAKEITSASDMTKKALAKIKKVLMTRTLP